MDILDQISSLQDIQSFRSLDTELSGGLLPFIRVSKAAKSVYAFIAYHEKESTAAVWNRRWINIKETNRTNTTQSLYDFENRAMMLYGEDAPQERELFETLSDEIQERLGDEYAPGGEVDMYSTNEDCSHIDAEQFPLLDGLTVTRCRKCHTPIGVAYNTESYELPDDGFPDGWVRETDALLERVPLNVGHGYIVEPTDGFQRHWAVLTALSYEAMREANNNNNSFEYTPLSPTDTSLLITNGNQCVGYLSMDNVGVDLIKYAYVRPEFRNQGFMQSAYNYSRRRFLTEPIFVQNPTGDCRSWIQSESELYDCTFLNAVTWESNVTI